MESGICHFKQCQFRFDQNVSKDSFLVSRTKFKILFLGLKN